MKVKFSKRGNIIRAEIEELEVIALVTGYQFNFMDELYIKTPFGVIQVDDDCKKEFLKVIM